MARKQRKTEQGDHWEAMAPLRKILKDLGIDSDADADYRELGSAIAKRQKDPPRHIPYNGFTVRGWANGELLPSIAAEMALYEELEARAKSAEMQDTNIEKRIEALSDNMDYARDEEQGLHKAHAPTELSHALLTVKRTLDLTYDNIANIASKRNDSRRQVRLSNTVTGYRSLLVGKKNVYPTKYQTMFFQELLNAALLYPDNPGHQAVHAAGFDNKTLLRLHEQALRDRGDYLWQEAVKDNNLGGMLRAIRVRRGDSRESMAIQLLKMTKDQETLSGVVVGKWENGKDPIGHRQQSDSTMFEPYVKLAKLTDRAPNALARSIEQPWFTPEKETALRAAFTAMIKGKSRKSYERLSCKPVALPDSKDIPPSANILKGELSMQPMYGKGAGRDKNVTRA